MPKNQERNFVCLSRHKNDKNKLLSFFKLYERHFSSNPDQFEPVDHIKGNIDDNNSPETFDKEKDKTFLIGYYDVDKCLGGMILEYFSISNTILLSYIFVEEKSQGTGSILIQKGIKFFIETYTLFEVRGFFLEVENPLFQKESVEPLETIKKKYSFFRNKANAKYIKIPYVQPALSKEKSQVYSLNLMILPEYSDSSYGINLDKNIILDFLSDYFKQNIRDSDDNLEFGYIKLALDIEDFKEDIDPFGELDTPLSINISRLYDQIWNKFYAKEFDSTNLKYLTQKFIAVVKKSKIPLDQKIYLNEIPTLYTPIAKFEQVAICYQFIEKVGEDNYNKYCPFYYSFESDLLQDRYNGKNSPFTSSCERIEDVEIDFSTTINYTSEGRYENLIICDDSSGKILISNKVNKKFKAYLSYTHFHESKMRVWNIVMKPLDGVCLNEMEILQMQKYFSGQQEKYTAQCKFIHTSSNRILKNVFDQLNQNNIRKNSRNPRIAIHPSDTFELISGIVQIDTDYVSFAKYENNKKFDFNEFWNNFYLQFGSKKNTELEDSYVNSDLTKDFLSALCSFCTGIFDFQRLDYDEVVDTIATISPKSKFNITTINKKACINFTRGDEMFRNVSDNIGLSPYLIIPLAVVSNNYKLMQEAHSDLVSAYTPGLNLGTKSALKPFILSTLSKKKDLLLIHGKEIMYKELVTNVFQFETENSLYNTIHTHRGIDMAKSEVLEFNENVKNDLSNISSLRASLFELKFNLFIVFLTFFQIAEPLGIKAHSTKLYITGSILLVALSIFYVVRKISLLK